MAYRTYMNNTQIFGNNKYYPEWVEFLKTQGIEEDEEGCYKGELMDFMGALEAMEKIVLRLHKEREAGKKTCPEAYRGLFDFSSLAESLENKENDKFHTSLFDGLLDLTRDGYAFLPYALYAACKDSLEKMEPWAAEGHLHCYRLKEGQAIKVKAS